MPDSAQSKAVSMLGTPKFVRQDIPSLYVLKALCALFVVLIHVPTEAHLQALLSPMLYCAVPVFYIITGFFLYKGQYREELRSASKWIRKAFALSLLLNILYFIFYIFLGTKYNLVPTVAQSLMFGTGVRTFLWYLTALWEALVIFILLRRYAPRLLLYAPLLFAMNPFLGRYSVTIGINPNSLPNFLLLNALFVALPCIASGYILSQYRRNLVGTYRSKLVFTISVVFLYAEYIFDINFLPSASIHSYQLMTLPTSAALFLLFLKLSISFPRILIKIGKYDSGNIYYFHMIAAALIPAIHSIPSSLHPLVVFLLAMFFSEMMRKMSKCHIPNSK